MEAEKSPGKIIAKKCDVTNEAEVLSVFDWVKEKFGHLDIFINNAGVIKSDMLLGNAIDHYYQRIQCDTLKKKLSGND